MGYSEMDVRTKTDSLSEAGFPGTAKASSQPTDTIIQVMSMESARAPRGRRFLRGRANMLRIFIFPVRSMSPVRSSVAHGRIRNVHIPDEHRRAVFTANDLVDVKPIAAATALSGFKHCREPILAGNEVHYVGELVAACVAPSRAQAEDIAAAVRVDYEELEPVVDMLAARREGAPLVHKEWGDNVFIEFFQDSTGG